MSQAFWSLSSVGISVSGRGKNLTLLGWHFERLSRTVTLIRLTKILLFLPARQVLLYGQSVMHNVVPRWGNKP